jgi:sulfatase modifying factor 1
MSPSRSQADRRKVDWGEGDVARKRIVLALASVVALSAVDQEWSLLAQTPPKIESLRDCADCPELIVVPAGSFRMGSNEGMTDSVRPVRTVAIEKGFAVGKSEVTRAQFSQFVREAGHKERPARNCTSLSRDLQWEESDGARGWGDPGFMQDDSHPAVCVSWSDAKAYAAWLSKKTGKDYRLPSEAEWEYAARAGSRRMRYWGDEANEACRFANVWDETYAKQRNLPRQQARGPQARFTKGEARLRDEIMNPLNEPRTGPWFAVTHWCEDGYAFTAPAAQFSPNAFGLHDMIGNAMEWVDDCMFLDYNGAPADGAPRQQPGCTHRVMRGGSWASIPHDAQTAGRFFRAQDFRASDLGFRVARGL